MQTSLLRPSSHGCASLLLLFFCLVAGPASGASHQLWWQDAELQARQGHYGIVDTQTLLGMVASENPPLIIDTRADYEYRQGHLPGAVSLEFDMGDSFRLTEVKKARLLEVLGPDKARPVVFYCRSFR